MARSGRGRLKMLLGNGLTSARARFLVVLLGLVCVACPELGATVQNTATTIDIGKDGIEAAPAEFVQADARREMVLSLRVSDGATEEIAGVDADIASHNWHSLTVRAKDDEFVVSLDGTWVFTAFDKTLSQPGRIALWTKGDSVTRFDSIAITALPASERRY